MSIILPNASSSDQYVYSMSASKYLPLATGFDERWTIPILNADLPLDRWWGHLLVAMLKRHFIKRSDVAAANAYLSRALARASARDYTLLAVVLHEAASCKQFQSLMANDAMCLEFGVFRGLSANITARYLRAFFSDKKKKTPSTPIKSRPTFDTLLNRLLDPNHEKSQSVVDGFDTFTGLPRAWLKRRNFHGPINVYLQKGSFTNNGVLPPVDSRVKLHRGLFGETVPPFLAKQPSDRPIAWMNLDCDLEGGTSVVLNACGPRLRPGSRLHFHELLKLPDIDRASAWMRDKRSWARGVTSAAPPSDEARALHLWLRANPDVVLSLDGRSGARNREAALLRFVSGTAAFSARRTKLFQE